MVVDRVLDSVVLVVDEVELTLPMLSLLPMPSPLPSLMMPWQPVVSASVWDPLWVPTCNFQEFCYVLDLRRIYT